MGKARNMPSGAYFTGGCIARGQTGGWGANWQAWGSGYGWSHTGSCTNIQLAWRGGLAKGARVDVILLCVYVYDHERWECPFLLLASSRCSSPLMSNGAAKQNPSSLFLMLVVSHSTLSAIQTHTLPGVVNRISRHKSNWVYYRVRYGTYSAPPLPQQRFGAVLVGEMT